MIYSLHMVVAFALIGCVTSEKTRVSATTTPKYVTFAINSLSGNFSCQTNRDSSYVFCITSPKATAENPLPISRFFIYDIINDEMLLEESVKGGKVTWINDHEIEVTKTPGIIPAEEHANTMIFGYIYSVRQRSKYSRVENPTNSP